MINKFLHSVYLDDSLCKGCINCIKRCPTEAIRVRDGKARITSEFCIDCGECIRICPYHAKKSHVDALDVLKQYEYTVAIPEPSFYGQFNNLNDLNILLTGLIYLGFDDVFEASAASELVSEQARQYVDTHKDRWPIISSACPSVVRLIRVRFPNLIEHLLPINPPFEVAAAMARQRAVEKTGLPPEKIGIIFITPCPSKATYALYPLGKEKSEIDAVLAAKDVYPVLLPHMKKAEKNPMHLASSGRIGVNWGYNGGESGGMITDNYLAADGIESIIRVLEDLEDEKFQTLEFIELDACSGGCVGGVMNVENPYVAKSKIKHLSKYMPVSRAHCDNYPYDDCYRWTSPVEYEPVFRLGSSMIESINMMKEIDELVKAFPALDCGSCGAPTCRALAEDIVRGKAARNSCVQLLRSNIHTISQRYIKLAQDCIRESENADNCIYMLMNYVERLSSEVARLDLHHNESEESET